MFGRNREMDSAARGSAKFTTGIMAAGIALGFAILVADVYWSVVPLVEVLGPVMAWTMSLFSTAVEAAGMALLTDRRYRKMLGSGVYVVAALTTVTFVYDIGSNWWGLSTAGGSATALSHAVRGSIAVMMAFIEYIIDWFVILLSGKSAVARQLETAFGFGAAGRDRPPSRSPSPVPAGDRGSEPVRRPPQGWGEEDRGGRFGPPPGTPPDAWIRDRLGERGR